LIARDRAELIGGNPASNHPRLMRSLMSLRRRGGHVIVINPAREVGLVNFRVPSDPRSLMFGTAIASEYVQPHIGGDLALLTGIARLVLERGKCDLGFIDQSLKPMGKSLGNIQRDAVLCREVEAALRVSDLAIIPIQPAGLDIWTLGLIDDRIGEAKTFNERLQAFVILNRTSWNPKDNDADEAREAIRSCTNLQLTNVAVCDRVAVKRAAPAGLTVSEYKPTDPKAAQEMTQLYGFVFGEK